MSLDSTREVVALVGGLVAIFAACFGGYVKWLRPKTAQAEAVGEAILGRPEVRDRSGAVIQPAQPGMVAQVANLTETVRELALMNQRMERAEGRLDNHDLLLTELHSSHRERIASKAEQIAAWSAIEAVSKTTPPAED